MSIGNPTEKSFFERQEEDAKKFAELLDIISSLPGRLSDSNEAYEKINSISDFKKDFEKEIGSDGKKITLKNFQLGRILLSLPVDFELPYDKDGKIEEFIRKLGK